MELASNYKTIDMFNTIRTAARQLLIRRNLFGISLSVFFCILLWAVAHYEFGFYLDRAHSRGSRTYRINSYEQFMQHKTGQATMVA